MNNLITFALLSYFTSTNANPITCSCLNYYANSINNKLNYYEKLAENFTTIHDLPPPKIYYRNSTICDNIVTKEINLARNRMCIFTNGASEIIDHLINIGDYFPSDQSLYVDYAQIDFFSDCITTELLNMELCLFKLIHRVNSYMPQNDDVCDCPYEDTFLHDIVKASFMTKKHYLDIIMSNVGPLFEQFEIILNHALPPRPIN